VEAPLRAPVLAFTLLLCGSSLAAPVGQAYLCVHGHEQDATTKLQTFVRQSVVDFFRSRRIAINSTTLQITLSSGTQAGMDGPPYLSFSGGAPAGGDSALAASSVAGTVAAQDGTKFNVLLSSGSDTQDSADYRVVSTQRGFDREGNAIGQHCGLKLFNSGASGATESLLIVNAASGHTLGLIRLPASISLY
jgi:hypothetical protein